MDLDLDLDLVLDSLEQKVKSILTWDLNRKFEMEMEIGNHLVSFDWWSLSERRI